MRKMSEPFQGLTEDTYRFFWELAFQNNKSFFEANRERYKKSVRDPAVQLSALLSPVAEQIDPAFQTNPAYTVSRIHRDTRFSKDKTPYRDHVWIGYKYPKTHTGESFVVFAEFERERYGYGMGMYYQNNVLMNQFRARMTAKSGTFLSVVNEKRFRDLFQVFGDSYKRPRYESENDALVPWLNLKQLSFVHYSTDLSRTMRPEIADEIREGFLIMKPVYRFLMGLD